MTVIEFAALCYFTLELSVVTGVAARIQTHDLFVITKEEFNHLATDDLCSLFTLN